MAHKALRQAIMGLAMAIFAGAVILPASAVALPLQADLGMGRLADISITTSGERRLLRFSATIVNVGSAPFDVRATRSSTSSEFAVVQRIIDDTGGSTDVPTTATTAFGGDGHLHWHITNLEHYELTRLDNGSRVGTSAKSGFCFFDTTAYRLSLPGAPSAPVYRSPGCGLIDSLALTMGLSVGWGDTYPAALPDQYIDITGLSYGRYRLTATADAERQFVEANESNNATWVDLMFSKQGQNTRVKITGYGPAA